MDRLSTKGAMVEQVNLGQIPTSSFDRKNHNFMSGKLGKIIPTRWDEVYPADRIKGSTTIVANFEPLAGPILGNMVCKQESFYIPMDAVWKNAYKFFTGKHGFDSPIPSLSPRKLYVAWAREFRIFCSKTLRDIIQNYVFNFPISADNVTDFDNEVVGLVQDSYDYLVSWSDEYQVRDLIKPALDLIEKYFYSGLEGDASPVLLGPFIEKFNAIASAAFPDAETMVASPEYKDFALWLCEFYTEFFDFFFGPSSLLDYMGWPINDDWRGYFVGDADNPDYLFSADAPNFTYYDLLQYGADDHDNDFDENLFSTIPLNWLPFRANYLCWYWNYRDQLLETAALDPEGDDFLSDSPSNLEIKLLSLLRVRCWYKDTYTTALTNTGDGNLMVPTVSDISDSDLNYRYYGDDGALLNTTDANAAIQAGALTYGVTVGGVEYRIPMNYLAASSNPNFTQLEGVGPAISLDMFDRIRRLRSFIQRRLILGYEYDDVIWSSFRVKVSNVRLRIPELLSRGRDVVDISTIVNNTTTTEQDAGDKTAIAWAKGNGSDINYFAEEHGFYIHYMTIMPLQSYLGGLSRSFLRRETFDFMWPEFATMGMDAVYNAELSAPRGAVLPSGLSDETAMAVFGYQGRYYDLKTRLDESHGRMRTDLRYMTFSREFNEQNPPKLNYIFVHCWPSTDMFVVNDPNVDVIRQIDVFHDLDFQRQLPVPSEFV